MMSATVGASPLTDIQWHLPDLIETIRTKHCRLQWGTYGELVKRMFEKWWLMYQKL
jgi:hypothetical protein